MTRQADIYVSGKRAALLMEEEGRGYRVIYDLEYEGPPISLTLPVRVEAYMFQNFPPFFDGLLPEGPQLEGLLRYHKLDRTDYLGQLLAVGEDLVGVVTVRASG